MKPIQFSCQIEQVKANKDRTLTVKLETQELAPEDTARIFALMERQIWCALAEVDIKAEDLDIPESVPEFKGDKTPSQRLRSRMFVYYKETHGNTEGFKNWYENALEKLGGQYLDKLN